MDGWSFWGVPAILLYVLIVILLLVYGMWPMLVWRRLGVAGPMPWPFIGNGLQIARKGLFNATIDWGKTYGDFYGIYIMREPVLLTSNLEILTEVMVKQHCNFSDRAPEVPLLPSPVDLGLVTASGSRWKRLRKIMSPAFSAGNLKKMESFISRCCHNLVFLLKDHCNQRKPVHAKHIVLVLYDLSNHNNRVFGAYTLDVFAGTGLGLNTNCLQQQRSAVLANVEAVLRHSDFINVHSALAGRQVWPMSLASCPFLVPLLRFLGCSVLPVAAIRFVEQSIYTLMACKRNSSNEASADLLQLLLEAQGEVPGGLSDEEIVAQGIVFFVAGYDTSAICLHYLAYLLATHPDKQERLYHEILGHIPQDQPVTYSHVKNMQYLDSCVFECLRLYPPVPVFARKAREDRTIGRLKIPAGCSVGAPVLAILRNPRYFLEADDFIPERFDDEERPVPAQLKHLPFGLGPRRCIGMSLALLEIKMAIVSALRHFRFIKIKDTPNTLSLSRHIISTPVQPLVFGCQRRHQHTLTTATVA